MQVLRTGSAREPRLWSSLEGAALLPPRRQARYGEFGARVQHHVPQDIGIRGTNRHMPTARRVGRLHLGEPFVLSIVRYRREPVRLDSDAVEARRVFDDARVGGMCHL